MDSSNINCLIKIFTFLMSVKGMCSFIYLKGEVLLIESSSWLEAAHGELFDYTGGAVLLFAHLRGRLWIGKLYWLFS